MKKVFAWLGLISLAAYFVACGFLVTDFFERQPASPAGSFP